MKQSFTSTEIVNFLAEGRNIELITKYLYGLVKEKIISYVRKNSGSLQDGQDLIQDVLIAFLKSVRDGKINQDSTIEIEPFLMGITKNLWNNKLRQDFNRNRRVETYARGSELDTENEDDFLEVADFWKVIDNLGDVCKQILRAYYQLGYSNEEIANLYELGETNAVKVRKYRCMEKLRKQFNL